MTDTSHQPSGDRQQNESPQIADAGDSLLPCGCGPGIRNIGHTDSPFDYECPDCNVSYRSEVVDDG